MNPNDPSGQNPTPTPTPTPPASPAGPSPDTQPSYLDVVGETDKKDFRLFGIFPKKMLLIAGGVLALLVVVLVIAGVVNNSQKAANAQITALGTKINELRVVLEYSNNNPISSSTTTAVVAETDVIVASNLIALANVYPAIDPENSLDEAQVSAIAELNDAKARGDLNSAYVNVLRQQLQSTCSQIEILQSSASETQKIVLDQAFSDFQELANRLPTPVE